MKAVRAQGPAPGCLLSHGHELLIFFFEGRKRSPALGINGALGEVFIDMHKEGAAYRQGR
jgi:hypothetical protein